MTVAYVLWGLVLVVVLVVALQLLGIISWPGRWWAGRRRNRQ